MGTVQKWSMYIDILSKRKNEYNNNKKKKMRREKKEVPREDVMIIGQWGGYGG